MYTYYPKICEMKTKKWDFYLQFALVEKWYAEQSKAGEIFEFKLWKIDKILKK